MNYSGVKLGISAIPQLKNTSNFRSWNSLKRFGLGFNTKHHLLFPSPSSHLKYKMGFPNKIPSLNLQQHSQNLIHNLQNHCSTLLHNLSTSLHQHQQNNPFNLNLNFPSFNLEDALQNLTNQAKNKFESTLSSSSKLFLPKTQHKPCWARVSAKNEYGVHRFDLAMSSEQMEERLAGVLVYTLSNSAEEVMLISGVGSGKAMGLFCFKEEDAQALLQQMKSMNPSMRLDSKVAPVALNQVVQLRHEGVAFRLIPEASQVKNALKEKQKAGVPEENFYGVPVFQSPSLILKSDNKRYRPVFFRKEDLENSLLNASQQQNQLNPLLRPGAIQVCVLEDIVSAMKENSTSKWDDVVFVPPGYNVSTDLTPRQRLTASG